jgi:cell division protein FtsW (lipid II flippase)
VAENAVFSGFLGIKNRQQLEKNRLITSGGVTLITFHSNVNFVGALGVGFDSNQLVLLHDQ